MKNADSIQVVRAKLLDIGGERVVMKPKHHLWHLLVQYGVLFELPATLRLMEPSRCHLNVASLWHQRKRGSRLIGIAPGYALDTDGLWVFHSWALTKSRIIETTVLRTRYFGMPCYGPHADFYLSMCEQVGVVPAILTLARIKRAVVPS
jgi:hypothetical protein